MTFSINAPYFPTTLYQKQKKKKQKIQNDTYIDLLHFYSTKLENLNNLTKFILNRFLLINIIFVYTYKLIGTYTFIHYELSTYINTISIIRVIVCYIEIGIKLCKIRINICIDCNRLHDIATIYCSFYIIKRIIFIC